MNDIGLREFFHVLMYVQSFENGCKHNEVLYSYLYVRSFLPANLNYN